MALYSIVQFWTCVVSDEIHNDFYTQYTETLTPTLFALSYWHAICVPTLAFSDETMQSYKYLNLSYVTSPDLNPLRQWVWLKGNCGGGEGGVPR